MGKQGKWNFIQVFFLEVMIKIFFVDGDMDMRVIGIPVNAGRPIQTIGINLFFKLFHRISDNFLEGLLPPVFVLPQLLKIFIFKGDDQV